MTVSKFERGHDFDFILNILISGIRHSYKQLIYLYGILEKLTTCVVNVHI